MQKLTVFKILSSFSEKDMKAFEEFIKFPLFNNAAYVRNYFLHISKYHPFFKNLKAENIFNEVYPGKKFSDPTIRRLNSELLKLAERFIIMNAVNERKFLRERILLEELDQRKADTHFTKKMAAARLHLENDQKGESYYRELYELNETEFIFHSTRDQKKGVEQYFNSLEVFDKYHAVQKLKKLIAITLQAQLFTGVDYDRKKVEDYVRYVRDNKFFSLPIIELLSYILFLSLEMNEKYYFELKRLIAVHKKIISEDELEFAYILMLNFCTFEHNKGKGNYVSDELAIYKDLIDADLLVVSNTLEGILFKNIISCALEARDIKFAEKFLEDFKKYLTSADKESIISYCRANISYAKKDYVTALEILSRINFKDENQKLSLRTFNLRIFYEQNMDEPAFAAVDAFRHTLKRETGIGKKSIALYITFLNFYERMLKLKTKPDKFAAGILKKELVKTETISKNWLMRMIEGL